MKHNLNKDDIGLGNVNNAGPNMLGRFLGSGVYVALNVVLVIVFWGMIASAFIMNDYFKYAVIAVALWGANAPLLENALYIPEGLFGPSANAHKRMFTRRQCRAIGLLWPVVVPLFWIGLLLLMGYNWFKPKA